MFSDLEKRALEVFVTSADSPIYAIRHTLPPEMFGAFGSYFSRNPKDFREHLLDAIKGTIDGGLGLKEDPETGELMNLNEGLEWVAEKSLDPSLAIKIGLQKSQDFFKKWYGKYSHRSIANEVWIPMVANNVSQMFARELAYEQLAFFIEQSTRYVKWGKDKMFLDPNIMQSPHSKKFVSAIDTLLESYESIVGRATEFYLEKNTFRKWLEKQPDEIQNASLKRQQNKYRNQIQGAALDVARFMLPQAAQTNIAWIVDARSAEFDIGSWKGHPLQEIRNAAELIEKNAGMIAPSLLKYTDKNNYYGDKLSATEKAFEIHENGLPWKSEQKAAYVISHEENSLETSLAHILKRHSFGGSFRQKFDVMMSLGFDEKINLLRKIVQDRGYHDDKVETDEDFDLVKATVEVMTDIGATRDLRRHQKFDRSEPLYTTENGFYMPPMIADMHPDARIAFDRGVNMADETHRRIKKTHPFEAQYVVPMATRHSITLSGGLDQFQYFMWTRTTPQGNFSYREDTFNVAEAMVKTHPWMLGYESYPKGKPFLEVYEEAPLKGLLRLQTGDTDLHA